MSRVYDYTVAAVVHIIAIVMHLFAVEAFQPGSALYDTVVSANGPLPTQQYADLWFQIGAIWVPLIGIAGIWGWMLLNEYRRQVVTASRRPV